MKRTFIAIPVEATASLRQLIQQLREQFRGEGFSWVDPVNFHVTLRFLGDTPEGRLEALPLAMRQACRDFHSERGEVRGLGYFSFKGAPSVLFARIEGWGTTPLLAAALDRELEELGFPSGDHDFRAHLTLARMKNLRDKMQFKEVISQYREEKFQQADASRVVLFESILRPQGPLYKPLTIVSL